MKLTTPSRAATVALTVQATGKSKATLDRVGSVRVKVAIAFAPSAGTVTRKSTTVVLKKR